MPSPTSAEDAVKCSACGAHLIDLVVYGNTTMRPKTLVVKCWCGDHALPIELTRQYGFAPASVKDPKEPDDRRNITEICGNTLDGDTLTLETRPC